METQELLEIISGRRKGFIASFARGVLGLLTPIYRLGIYWVNRKYDRAARQNNSDIIHSVPIPVISIGNLTTGGTGKTPLVIWMARHVQSAGRRVAIISRGYGIREDEQVSGNDEAREMKVRIPDVPHLQDPDRYRMAQIAVKELGSQIILLDDGFQHRRLHRDLDIVLIDAINPFGYDRLLPRGLLREPPASLARADLIVVTRANLVSAGSRQELSNRIRRFNERAPLAETSATPRGWLRSDGTELPIEHLGGKTVFGFCGIGNPEGFRETLAGLDVMLRGWKTFPDHYAYTQQDLDQIATQAHQSGASTLVCTHKDLVKISDKSFRGVAVFALLIETDFLTGQAEFENQLQRVVVPRRHRDG